MSKAFRLYIDSLFSSQSIFRTTTEHRYNVYRIRRTVEIVVEYRHTQLNDGHNDICHFLSRLDDDETEATLKAAIRKAKQRQELPCTYICLW